MEENYKEIKFMTLDKNEINKAGKFIVKFTGTGVDANNKLNPGWTLETQAEHLLSRLDEKTALMQDATFIQMPSRQYALDFLYVRPQLQPMKSTGGMFSDTLGDLTETIPIFARRELDARPFVAYTRIPKQFVWENVEHEGFLPLYESLLADACGASVESLAVYSDTDATGNYGEFDGIFKQLAQISALTDEEAIRENGKGYYGAIDVTPASGTIAEQVMDFITAFADQKGNIDNAVVYVSTVFKGKLLAECAKRESDLGDTVYVNGKDISVFGVPIKTADFLNRPAEGYNERLLMADPKSIVFGVVSNIESESTYEHWLKSYLTSVDLEFDAGMIYPVDVLYADVTDGANFGTVKNETESSVTLIPQNNETSANVTVATNSSVQVPVGTYKNGANTVKVTKDKVTVISA